MKYWLDDEIEHLVYAEGTRGVPFKHPAAIISDNDNYIEVEIVPGTCGKREYVCPSTFDTKTGLCVEMERRIWRGNSGMFIEEFFAPLEILGYDEEPISHIESFESAMKII